MTYVCIIDGLVEFTSTTVKDFAHYIMMYENEIFEAEDQGKLVEMLELTDEEFDAMFPCEEEEE